MNHIQIKIICPTCGFNYDAAFCTTGAAKPQPGHFGICLKCGEILIFNDQLVMVVSTPKQLAGLAARTPFLYDQLIATKAALRKKQQTQRN